MEEEEQQQQQQQQQQLLQTKERDCLRLAFKNGQKSGQFFEN